MNPVQAQLMFVLVALLTIAVIAACADEWRIRRTNNDDDDNT